MNNDIEGLIRDARNLRDYALLSGSVSASDLIKSLTPYDLNPDLKDEEKLMQLQMDVASTARSIDPDTRHRVLTGQFRQVGDTSAEDGGLRNTSEYAGLRMNGGDYFSAVTLVVLGFVALWLLASYSIFAVRSSQWLTEFNERGERDYVAEMIDLFDVVVSTNARVFTAPPSAQRVGDDPAESKRATYIFMSNVARLNAMVAQDERLRREARELELKYYWCMVGEDAWHPVQHLTNFLFSAKCPVTPPPSNPAEAAPEPIKTAISRTTTPTEAVALYAHLQDALESVNAARKEVSEAVAESRRSATSAAQQVAIARDSLSATESRLLYNMRAYPGGISDLDALIADGIKTLTRETTNQWSSGLSALEGKFDPRNYNSTLDVAESSLKRYLSTVNGWILPVLFGALGAIVLCLTRTASKFYATPSVAGILARLALAMLGGALISIVLAPTYFAAAVTAGSSFVFLLCFVFGYSTSAFVTLLDNIANKLAGTKV